MQQQAATKIKEIIKIVETERPIAPEEMGDILEALKEYECWAPFFRLIKRNIQSKSQVARMDDYVLLAFIQNVYLEDVFSAAATAEQLVVSLKIVYDSFHREFVPRVVEPEDWTAEASILHAVCDSFTEHSDRVSCLERLCLLYEKKIFNETRLNEVYTKLIEVDPRNIKALRYFKVVFTQNYDWEKVVDILHRMVDASRHPQDVFRIAQELAAVYLYQLDKPDASIEVIESYCEGSPLDTSTIHYDSYQRISDWEGCLRVLRECLLGVTEDGERAILHYRIGKLEEKAERLDSAKKEYEKSMQLWPKFLEPYEALIGVQIEGKDWTSMRRVLKQLTDKVDDYGTRARLTEIVARLDDGLKQNDRN